MSGYLISISLIYSKIKKILGFKNDAVNDKNQFDKNHFLTNIDQKCLIKE